MSDDPENRSHREEGKEGEEASGTDERISSISIPAGYGIRRIRPSQDSTPNPCRKRFGDILRKIRKVRGKSIYELAREAEVDGGYISRLENAHRNPPTPKVLQKFADALNIRIDLLMLAAGYLEFDESGKRISEEDVLRKVEAALLSPPDRQSAEFQPSVEVKTEEDFSLLPMLERDDLCLGITDEGEQVIGKAVLFLIVGDELVSIAEISGKVNS